MKESLRDRLASLSRRELGGLVGVVLIALAAVGLWYVRSLPRPVEVRTAAVRPVGAAVASPTPSPAELVVNVAGWVVHPGVYEFHDGDRVIDALQAAGGARKGAALDALNLAALLTDAEQILVPKLGPGGAVAGVAVAGGTSAASGSTALINVNTATEIELEDLPGIGPVLAQRIVDYRTEHGPFPTVDALDDVSGIGPATLDDLRDMVTV
ncbi:MAG: ComEA family DNA-binding protein [Actinomycetota bacterium]